MSPRKPMSELSEPEKEKRRAYMREAKAKSRDGKPPEKDIRTGVDRAEYRKGYYQKTGK